MLKHGVHKKKRTQSTEVKALWDGIRNGICGEAGI
jgi:hypothetical protein